MLTLHCFAAASCLLATAADPARLRCCMQLDACSFSRVQVAITRDLQKCPEVVRFLGIYEVCSPPAVMLCAVPQPLPWLIAVLLSALVKVGYLAWHSD